MATAPGSHGSSTDAADLEAQLERHGHLLPLPKEPAALANVLEVSIVDFLLDRIAASDGALTAARGGERFYPDLRSRGRGWTTLSTLWTSR